LEDINDEIQNIRQLCSTPHGHIVRVLRDGWLDSRCCFIDMELCDINLEEYIHNRSPRMAEEPKLLNEPVFVQQDCSTSMHMLNTWIIINHICSGVQFIHENGFSHRDIKPANGCPTHLTLADKSLVFRPP